ncbi:NAD(P)-dependent oxidoreductase [Paenibacillus sp. N1-5-1-14]|uniref:NAD-dependent epimerase/dehydratase family protein n=1 Tax=Paenibacillus radicibacter TaxID=2972488 RepID=UPI0021591FBA|nr:NAD(P)-dependent oxidoreductase [Paenibacillus radicibacter]MCR8643448.1 NAD(P)-dependent oxidoreductase [Paenibacillus radicibacter]
MCPILVTGGSGWIGRYVIRELLRKGYNVHATYHRSKPADLACTWHQVNLLRDAEVAELIHLVKPSYLVHLAWEAVPPKCYEALNNYYWVQASMGLMRHFAENGGERVFVAGTCAEYEWVDGFLTENGSNLSFQTPYALCKNTFRIWLESYAAQMCVSLCWGRIFHMYGPHESGSRLVSSLITSLLKGESAKCTHGKQSRDFMYVEDVARAVVELIGSGVEGIVNIGSGTPLAIKQIATGIGARLGRLDLIKFGQIPLPAHEPMLVAANVDRLRDELNWKPQITLDEGIDRTIAWWRSQSFI